MTHAKIRQGSSAEHCCGPAARPEAESSFVRSIGGRYKQVVAYEYVGAGRGDHDKRSEQEQRASVASSWERWALIAIALAALVVAVIVILWRVPGWAYGADG
eukprot:CAMPEP_0170305804 /NCGR_PEP_ID=MMETSP0116_2-20130129/53279_1 /TAXON_ID=400756 /ORGANISM="Durinskia baltica, Strain CSIRO CS-38" /LENGTH=101 /DNA_ID=CAMNT_0010557861 /DNA_START=24 /DNA_END=325 /DNA_ORIENTATION=+